MVSSYHQLWTNLHGRSYCLLAKAFSKLQDDASIVYLNLAHREHPQVRKAGIVIGTTAKLLLETCVNVGCSQTCCVENSFVA